MELDYYKAGLLEKPDEKVIIFERGIQQWEHRLYEARKDLGLIAEGQTEWLAEQEALVRSIVNVLTPLWALRDRRSQLELNR